MVKIVKHQSSDGAIDYEFVGFDCWDDFDFIANVLIGEWGADVIDKLDGIYSRHWILVIEGIQFKLMYHEDTGNCLLPLSKDDVSHNFLEDLANKLLPYIFKTLSDN